MGLSLLRKPLTAHLPAVTVLAAMGAVDVLVGRAAVVLAVGLLALLLTIFAFDAVVFLLAVALLLVWSLAATVSLRRLAKVSGFVLPLALAGAVNLHRRRGAAVVPIRLEVVLQVDLQV